MRRTIASLAGLTCVVMWCSACALKPTRGTETVPRAFAGADALLGPLKLSEQSVILDTRSSFDFSMARIPRSHHVNWVDYSEPEPTQRGWLQRDLFAAARRLARLGVGPDTPIVVLGLGREGQGEEGRVAWMLAYLGVKDVRFGRFDSVKARLTTSPPAGFGDVPGGTPLEAEGDAEFRKSLRPTEPPAQEVPIWKPQVVEDLLVADQEFREAMKKGEAGGVRFIDVRPARDYLGQSGGLRAKAIPNLGALNLPWKDLFDDNFRPARELRPQLAALGVRDDDRLIVLDHDGVAACASVMALRAMGFGRAGCFAGGYNHLLAK
jgi:3-mercaptopyruvate sulfurtransferase SseA